MAIVDDDGYVHGTVGPTSSRKRRGKQTLQAKPGKGRVKQSEGTKKLANTFGIASSFAAEIRSNLHRLSVIPDGNMVNRLNKMMYQIVPRHQQRDTRKIDFKLKAFKSLEYFEMNVNAPFRENLWVLPEIKLEDGKLLIHLPEINVEEDLYFPVGGNSCTICIEVAIGALYEGCYRRPDDTSSILFEVPKEAIIVPAQDWTIDVLPGCYCLTAMALHYYQKQRLLQSLNSEKCCPAMICDFSITPGKFSKPDNRSWIRTSFFFNKDIKVEEEKTNQEEDTTPVAE